MGLLPRHANHHEVTNLADRRLSRTKRRELRAIITIALSGVVRRADSPTPGLGASGAAGPG